MADKQVSNAPMASAELKYDAGGRVAWDEMWADFCDLALAGGPPHRGTVLEPVTAEVIRAEPERYAEVVAEIERGLRLITGLEVVKPEDEPGWIGLVCTDEAMSLWMLRAITAENVWVWRDGVIVYLPAGPDFRLKYEIKNVITAVAKTHHYWTEHYQHQPL